MPLSLVTAGRSRTTLYEQIVTDVLHGTLSAARRCPASGAWPRCSAFPSGGARALQTVGAPVGSSAFGRAMHHGQRLSPACGMDLLAHLLAATVNSIRRSPPAFLELGCISDRSSPSWGRPPISHDAARRPRPKRWPHCDSSGCRRPPTGVPRVSGCHRRRRRLDHVSPYVQRLAGATSPRCRHWLRCWTPSYHSRRHERLAP